MRVIAGKFKSRLLKSVDSNKTRPTTDKNKENLFNIIGPYFEGGICLDLFAGSGGLGIEAISRGMDELYSVDHQYKAYSVIKENIKSLKIEDIVHLYKMDYRKALGLFKDNNVKFDMVLLDPPYGMNINYDIINYLKDNNMLNNDCIIVIEDLVEMIKDVEYPFNIKKEQSYGITKLQILRYEG